MKFGRSLSARSLHSRPLTFPWWTWPLWPCHYSALTSWSYLWEAFSDQYFQHGFFSLSLYLMMIKEKKRTKYMTVCFGFCSNGIFCTGGHVGYLKMQDRDDFWYLRCFSSLMIHVTTCTKYLIESNVLWEGHNTTISIGSLSSSSP